MTRVEDKVKQLHHLHKRHLARPTLDDDVSQEEAEIQSQTKEVTEVVTSPQSRKKIFGNLHFFSRCFQNVIVN